MARHGPVTVATLPALPKRTQSESGMIAVGPGPARPGPDGTSQGSRAAGESAIMTFGHCYIDNLSPARAPAGPGGRPGLVTIPARTSRNLGHKTAEK